MNPTEILKKAQEWLKSPFDEKTKEEDIHTITLSKEKLQDIRSKLPFLKDADDFSILL